MRYAVLRDVMLLSYLYAVCRCVKLMPCCGVMLCCHRSPPNVVFTGGVGYVICCFLLFIEWVDQCYVNLSIERVMLRNAAVSVMLR